MSKYIVFFSSSIWIVERKLPYYLSLYYKRQLRRDQDWNYFEHSWWTFYSLFSKLMNSAKEHQWGQVLLLQENLFRIFNMSSWITCLTRATRLRPASQHQHIFYVINVLPCLAPLTSAQWSEILSKCYLFILLRILWFHKFTRYWRRIHFTYQHVCNTEITEIFRNAINPLCSALPGYELGFPFYDRLRTTVKLKERGSLSLRLRERPPIICGFVPPTATLHL